MRITSTLLVVAALPSAAFAQLHTGDIAVTGVSGSVETGVIEGGSPIFGQRVFDTAFGELPNWTNDPGFDSPSDAFPPRTQLGFDVMHRGSRARYAHELG